MLEEHRFKDFLQQRYQGWDQGLGADILKKKYTFEQISDYALKYSLNPKPVSGRQELLENLFASYIK